MSDVSYLFREQAVKSEQGLRSPYEKSILKSPLDGLRLLKFVLVLTVFIALVAGIASIPQFDEWSSRIELHKISGALGGRVWMPCDKLESIGTAPGQPLDLSFHGTWLGAQTVESSNGVGRQGGYCALDLLLKTTSPSIDSSGSMDVRLRWKNKKTSLLSLLAHGLTRN